MFDSDSGMTITGLLGGILAGLMSWFKWHSIFWVIIHGALLGWLYVIYYLLVYGKPNF